MISLSLFCRVSYTRYPKFLDGGINIKVVPVDIKCIYCGKILIPMPSKQAWCMKCKHVFDISADSQLALRGLMSIFLKQVESMIESKSKELK